jgi:hypothetical protein
MITIVGYDIINFQTACRCVLVVLAVVVHGPLERVAFQGGQQLVRHFGTHGDAVLRPLVFHHLSLVRMTVRRECVGGEGDIVAPGQVRKLGGRVHDKGTALEIRVDSGEESRPGKHQKSSVEPDLRGVGGYTPSV